jgi:hypothetical protein
MAPLGNKYALGNEGGRPRERDRKQLAKQLIEWAQLPTSTNLLGFGISLTPPLSPQRLSEYSKDDPEFKEAVQLAKAIIGQRREQLVSKNQLHSKAYDLNAPVYDYYLKEERRDEFAYQQALKQQADSQIIDDVKDGLLALMNQVKLRQELTKTQDDSRITLDIKPNNDK